MQIGIDLGSRTVKAVLWQNGALVRRQVTESSLEPHRQALVFMQPYPEARVVATGYGRHLMRQHAQLDVITEIKAHALGARHIFPRCQAILDVGGQDSKVILLDKAGHVACFQMNDKCAAGTGRFLEMMAVSLGYDLDSFDRLAGETMEGAPIGRTCAVFAESEVISMRSRGVPAEVVARSVHLSVAGRLAAMVSKAGYGDHVVFTGGVAKSKTLVGLLEKELGVPLLVPEYPCTVGALGAALHAARH